MEREGEVLGPRMEPSLQAEERNAQGGSRRMASAEVTESRSSKALQGD